MQARLSAAGSAAISPDPTAELLAELLRELLVDPGADHFGLIEERRLTLTQVRALVALAGTDEPVASGALAEQLAVTAPTMTRALDGLVRRRLVSRREGADDRRVRHLALTATGRATVEELTALRRAGLSRWLERLPDPARERLSAALEAIAAERGWSR